MKGEANINNEKRTSKLNIVLSEKDKKILKIYDLNRDTSVSAIIHEYVEQLRKAGGENV